MSKSPFKGCWSFCTPDCQLKANNGCRTNIPQYDLPPPNENCLHLSELVFGRSDYEAEITAWYQACNAAQRNGDEPPPNWRIAVNDKYALRPIYLDPTREWLTALKYLPVKLWNPDTFYDLLLSSPAVIQATVQAVEGGAGIMEMRALEKQISLLFRTKYKEIWYAAENKQRSIPAEPPYIQPTIDQHWAKAWKFFELALPIIAQWCLLHHCSFPEQWAILIAKYVKFGMGWQNYAERVALADSQGDALRPPSKVTRVKTGQEVYTVKPTQEIKDERPTTTALTGIVRVKRPPPDTGDNAPNAGQAD